MASVSRRRQPHVCTHALVCIALRITSVGVSSTHGCRNEHPRWSLSKTRINSLNGQQERAEQRKMLNYPAQELRGLSGRRVIVGVPPRPPRLARAAGALPGGRGLPARSRSQPLTETRPGASCLRARGAEGTTARPHTPGVRASGAASACPAPRGRFSARHRPGRAGAAGAASAIPTSPSGPRAALYAAALACLQGPVCKVSRAHFPRQRDQSAPSALLPAPGRLPELLRPPGLRRPLCSYQPSQPPGTHSPLIRKASLLRLKEIVILSNSCKQTQKVKQNEKTEK